MPLVLPGNEVTLNEPGRKFSRHHHLSAYAAILVSGSCKEAGDHGRFEAGPGDVLVHSPFDGHADQIGTRGATFINVQLSGSLNAPFGRVADLDTVIRTMERHPGDAEAILRDQFVPIASRMSDWPDILARTLVADPSIRLGQWAEKHGLHCASISRGFGLAYGLSPRRYRLEQMAAKAARCVLGSPESLAGIATRVGFADQAHMTRSFADLFGITPAKLRLLS